MTCVYCDTLPGEGHRGCAFDEAGHFKEPNIRCQTIKILIGLAKNGHGSYIYDNVLKTGIATIPVDTNGMLGFLVLTCNKKETSVYKIVLMSRRSIILHVTQFMAEDTIEYHRTRRHFDVIDSTISFRSNEMEH